MEKMLHLEVKKLRQAQRVQEGLLRQDMASQHQGPQPNWFAQEVLRILEKEIPKLHKDRPPTGPSTFDSGPSSTLHVHFQSSPTRHGGGDHIFGAGPQAAAEEIPASAREIPRGGGSGAELPVRHGINSDSSYPVCTNNSSQQSSSPLLSSNLLPSVTGEGSQDENPPDEGIDKESDDQEREGTYMQMPPFGPPQLRTRPRAGRSSPDYLNPSTSRDRLQRDSTQHYHNENEEFRRRRDGGAMSEYGDGGEVTPTHMTGFAGLRPDRRGKGRGSPQ